MMIVPAGVKVHLASGYTDMRKGLDGLARSCRNTSTRIILRPLVCLPRQEGEHTEDPVLGRQRALLVQQKARSRRLHLAENE